MVLRALLLSALLTLVPVTIGVAVSTDTTPPAPKREPAAYTGTPLSDFDSAATVVRRAPFCELVPAEAVEAALGAAGTASGYDNGEQTDAVPGGDVAHEYGCRARPEAGSTGLAEGWVFAPPVTAGAARRLVAEARRTKGCDPLPATPAYGSPSIGLLCATGDERSVTYRGLYGDAWLACRLTLPAGTPQEQLLDRAGRWCVAVAQAAAVPVG